MREQFEKFAADFVEVYGGFPKDQAIALLTQHQSEIVQAAVAAERERALNVIAENRKAFRNESSREIVMDKIRSGDAR